MGKTTKTNETTATTAATTAPATTAATTAPATTAATTAPATTAATTAPATTAKPKLVELFIPRGPSVDEPNVVISVNGKNYVLPKGKTSEVPEFVKYEYDRSMRAKEAMDVRSAEMAERAAEEEKNPVCT